jgi:hypothetical protein
MAAALLYLVDGDAKRARVLLASAGEHPLASYVRSRLDPRPEKQSAGIAAPTRSTDAPTGVTASVAEGLVAHWAFDEGRGDIARDASPNGNHARILGASWVAGVDGAALSFDGEDDSVTVDNETNFDLTGSLTIAVWIKVATFSQQWQPIVTKGNSTWRLQRNRESGVIKFNCDGRGGQRGAVGRTQVADGAWHHIAATSDGTTLRLYVDGSEDGTARADAETKVNDHPVMIGAKAGSNDVHFHGVIDDVRIYRRALSADEVMRLARRR